MERHEIMELLGQLKLAGACAPPMTRCGRGGSARAALSFSASSANCCSRSWPIIAPGSIRLPCIGVARFPVMKNLAGVRLHWSRRRSTRGWCASRTRAAFSPSGATPCWSAGSWHRQEPHRHSDRRQLRAQWRPRALLHRRRSGQSTRGRAARRQSRKTRRPARPRRPRHPLRLTSWAICRSRSACGQMLFHLISRLYERTLDRPVDQLLRLLCRMAKRASPTRRATTALLDRPSRTTATSSKPATKVLALQNQT